MSRKLVILAVGVCVLSCLAAGQDSLNKQTDASSSAATPNQFEDSSTDANEKSDESFFGRLFDAYKRDWQGDQASASASERRIPPSPLDSPPFPNADWPYGGSPLIGAPDSNTYPLMEALNGNRSRIKIYGWIEPGFNFSTSKNIVYPMSYNIYANRLALDQAVIYVERLPDTVQTDHFDWGFHLTGFYGVDYRFTTSVGYFSQQLLEFNR